MSFQDNDGTHYPQGAVPTDIAVRITKIASSDVSGTFSGTLKSAGLPDKIISDGEFFVRRVN